jgi:hypothetical protein
MIAIFLHLPMYDHHLGFVQLKFLFKETLVHTHQQFILGENFAKCQKKFKLAKKEVLF